MSESFLEYEKLRNVSNLNIENFLRFSICNFDQWRNLQEKLQLNEMLAKFNNPELIKQLSDNGTKIQTSLRNFLRRFIHYSDIYLSKILKNYNKSGNLDKAFEKFDQTYSEVSKDEKFFKIEYPVQYSIVCYTPWRKIFKELANLKIDEANKSEVKVTVKFLQKNTQQKYKKLCSKINKNINQDNKNENNVEIVQMMKQIFASFIKFRHSQQQKQLFEQSDLLKLNQFEPKLQNSQDQELVSYYNPYVLIPQGMEITIDTEMGGSNLVHCMDQILKHNQYNQLCYKEFSQFSKKEGDAEDVEKDAEGDVEENEFQKLEYFFNYFYYYKISPKEKDRLQYAFVPEQILQSGKKNMQSTCFGLKEMFDSSSMKSLFYQFQNPISFLNCKGPLIYGPPGTGKTFIIQKMIDNFQIHLVFNGNSSNFQGSLVGQGSRLLTIYFNRARAIPWQPCAAHIGEIEELVQKKDSGESKSSEVLNKLLELTDGTETVGNVKVFSTTNHIEKIEEAILSRFNLIYLGKSNTTLRRDWIVWYFMNQKKNIGRLSNIFEMLMKGFFPFKEGDSNDVYNQFLTEKEEKQKEILQTKISEIVQYTINFSTRQLTDLLSHITSNILEGNLTVETTDKEKLQIILDCCKAKGLDQFKFGNQILPELMFQSLITEDNYDEDIEKKFLQIVQNPQFLNNKGQQQNQQQLKERLLQTQVITQPLLSEKHQSEQSFDVQQLDGQQLNEQYVHSRVILFDLSTDADQRINVLKHYEKDNTKKELYQKADIIYDKLKILIQSKMNADEIQKAYTVWDIRQFNKDTKQLLKKNRDYQIDQQQFQSKSLEDAIKILEKTKKDKNFDEKKVENKLNELINIKKKQDEIRQEFQNEIKYINTVCQNKLDLIKLESLNNDANISNVLKTYREQIDALCDDMVKNLKAIIPPQKILKKDKLKLYKLDYCELQEVSDDQIMKLLSIFIKNGEFSKVDMVDYHSCERNEALSDINSFKSYISNLIKEGNQEDKCLIVYKLDEFLNVSDGEDAALEKDKTEMAKKIFESINDTSNSNIWSIFITRNMNVVNLFYNVVQYWPRESRRGIQISDQQEQTKLLQCKFCKKQFKLCDEDDKCKEHRSDKFFINEDVEIYKKFKGDWQGQYLSEYYKQKKHQEDHQKEQLTDKQKAQNGCTYCDKNILITGDFYEKIEKLDQKSFQTMKTVGIIPQQYKCFESLQNLSEPITKEQAQEKIDKEKFFANAFKRQCCDGDFDKEECNPHKHVRTIQNQKNEYIQRETNNIIQAIYFGKK